MTDSPTTVGLIAGSRSLPLLFARQARALGERRLVAVAFENETDPALAGLVDEIVWLRVGQLAVATVILNRAKAVNYPSSICGVVYQGASRLNACQFSFACDGQSDLPQHGRAWETALAVAAMELTSATEEEPDIVGTSD